MKDLEQIFTYTYHQRHGILFDVTFSAEDGQGDCLRDPISASRINNTSQIPVGVIVDDEVDEKPCEVSITLTCFYEWKLYYTPNRK